MDELSAAATPDAESGRLGATGALRRVWQEICSAVYAQRGSSKPGAERQSPELEGCPARSRGTCGYPGLARAVRKIRVPTGSVSSRGGRVAVARRGVGGNASAGSLPPGAPSEATRASGEGERTARTELDAQAFRWCTHGPRPVEILPLDS